MHNKISEGCSRLDRAAAGCPRARPGVAWACQLQYRPWGMGKLKNKARKYFYVDVQSPKVEVRPAGYCSRKGLLLEHIGRALARPGAPPVGGGAGRQARQVRPTAAPSAPTSRAVRAAPPWPVVHPSSSFSASVDRLRQGGASWTSNRTRCARSMRPSRAAPARSVCLPAIPGAPACARARIAGSLCPLPHPRARAQVAQYWALLPVEAHSLQRERRGRPSILVR